METFSGKIDGPTTLETDLKPSGMVVGELSVPSGVHLIANGMATQNLLMKAGADVELNGMVNGKVIVEGGRLRVKGHTAEIVIHGVAADVRVSPDAFVGER